MTSRPMEERLEKLAAQIGRLEERVDTLADGMVTVVTETASSREGDGRVKELAAQVESLRQRVDELADGMVRVATEVAPEERPSTAAEGGAAG